MIEQYSITTTPKYNFPQPTMDTKLPQRFVEQSIYSLSHVQNQCFQLNQQNPQGLNNIQIMNTSQLEPRPVSLNADHRETVVAATDTSSMKIGETSTGILIAVRGANVWRQNRNYRYVRIGPFIFHITEENKKEVYDTLQRAYFNAPPEGNRNLPNAAQMQTRIAGVLERWQQRMLSRTVDKGLILLDGSLISGTIDTPIGLMKELLADARKKGNSVLAFSKMTTLRLNGCLITDLMSEHELPYLLEMRGLRTRPPTILLGDIYVARFNRGKCAFRLDIDREIPPQRKIEAVEKLLGNDVLLQSYPETLRLAHILCTFTANEVIAIQRFVNREYRLRLITRPDMHRLLFGPFGRGETCS